MLPQRAGLPGLNDGGTATVVPPTGITGLKNDMRGNWTGCMHSIVGTQ